jgi:hypothetical protein
MIIIIMIIKAISSVVQIQNCKFINTGDWRTQNEHSKILFLMCYKNMHTHDGQHAWTAENLSDSGAKILTKTTTDMLNDHHLC